MRSLIWILLALASCATEIVELSPGDAATLISTPDLGVVDTGTIDTGISDGGFVDLGFPDTGDDDAGPIDTGIFDSGTPDSGATCACVVACSITGDCQRMVDPSSTCNGGTCSGSTGPAGCRSDRDCASGLECRLLMEPARACS